MLRETEKTFKMPEDFDVEEFVHLSFGVFQGPLTKARFGSLHVRGKENLIMKNDLSHVA